MRHDDRIEFVAVKDQQASAVDGGMHRLFPDLDTAEIRACELAEHLVVIAGDIDDVRAALGALHDAADDRIVPLGPVKALLQSPAVDDVADPVEDIAVDVIDRKSTRLNSSH